MKGIDYMDIDLKDIERISKNEQFKPVVIDGVLYDGYWISNYGRAYSEIRLRFMANPCIR